MRLESTHFAWGEVGDDDDAASDEFFGGVPLGDAGEDLAGFVAEVDLEAEKLVGFGDVFGDDDAGDAEIDFDEVVDGDLRGVWEGGGEGGGGEGTGGGGFGVGRGFGALGGEGGAAGDLGSGV